jgi:hypothetical protein
MTRAVPVPLSRGSTSFRPMAGISRDAAGQRRTPLKDDNYIVNITN